MTRGRLIPWILRVAAVMAAVTAGVAFGMPVEFRFHAPSADSSVDPWARELWLAVTTPSGRQLRLPAYFVGDDVFAVRARPDEAGRFRAGPASETVGGATMPCPVAFVGPSEVEVTAATGMPSIVRDVQAGRYFRTSTGERFIPVGSNLAWSHGPWLPYYQNAFNAFGQAGLNWMRVWMSHWGQLNLDWLPPALGRSPPPGQLDARIGLHWDLLLDLAESKRVYVQLVLQHHGQYSTTTNSNWKDNPWNAANRGGFLRKPAEFFTSERARQVTRQKYRYIVARWSWSPAIFAWELFNEVHWVDPIKLEANEAIVAAWHNEMAAWIRSLDPYGHLVTTSTENLRSGCYDRTDFYQPHLYPAELIAAARTKPPGAAAERPVFYGEVGDDNMDAPEAVKKSGVSLVPPMWAGLFGDTRLPAQPWLGWDLIAQQRVAEAGAVARFIAGTGYAAQPELTGFSARTETVPRLPLRVVGYQVWQRRTPSVIDVPADGTLPVAFGEAPRALVGKPKSIADGFPGHVSYHFDFPVPSRVIATVTGLGAGSASLALEIDGKEVRRGEWSVNGGDRPTRAKPVELATEVPPGEHLLVVRNGGGEWVELNEVRFEGPGLEQPVIAGIGQRNDRFIAAWLWRRDGLYAVEPPAPIGGSLLLDDVPAGEWRLTWWDTIRGEPLAAARPLSHAGGRLVLPIPPIARHAAVVLTR